MASFEHSENPVAGRALRLNDPAPVFVARTTMGVRSLTDYRGKWLVLFSHPADFTPVCTTEFIALEKAADKFRALGCELLGLSADSIYSHLAWVQNIEERFGVTISFPIIEDLSLSIAEAYGMIDETSVSTATVRSVFFIDPEGIVRAQVHYPATVGRSVDELLRVLTALRATEVGDVAAPEGWRPEGTLLKAPPTTMDEVRARLGANGGASQDWYFAEADRG
ncbi:peroxiredoxin [Kordiimonas gwangyangensis]|uniref:peroxiredoxin n=1 Tax=Kordiimonas gwangyangensis TaxID=288022 RepID=UPI00036C9EB8|nr:peroxiredoxin [Kordiimonas gwangyangensis]